MDSQPYSNTHPCSTGALAVRRGRLYSSFNRTGRIYRTTAYIPHTIIQRGHFNLQIASIIVTPFLLTVGTVALSVIPV